MLKVCSMKAEVFRNMWTIIMAKLMNNFDHFNKTSWSKRKSLPCLSQRA